MIPKLRLYANRLSFVVDRITLWFCSILLVLMTLDLLVGIFCRYVILSPIIWTEEISRYMMIWAATLAMSSCIRRGEHLAVRFLVNILPKKIEFIVDIGMRIILAAFLIILTCYGISLARTNLDFSSQAMDLNMVFPTSAVPIGGALMLIQLVLSTLLKFSGGMPEKGEG